MTWHPQGQWRARGMWLTSKSPTEKHKSRSNRYKMELAAKNMCGRAAREVKYERWKLDKGQQ